MESDQFQLFISKEQEYLTSDRLKAPHFAITSCFCRAFKSILENQWQKGHWAPHDLLRGLQPTEIDDAIANIFKNLKLLGFGSMDIGSLESMQWGLRNVETLFGLFGEVIEQHIKTFRLLLECYLLRRAVNDWLEPKPLNSQRYLTPEQAFTESTIQIPGKNIQHSRAKFLIKNKSPDLMDNTEFIKDIETNTISDAPLIFYDNGELSLENVCYLLFKGYLEEVFRYRTRQVGAEMLLIEERSMNDPDYRTREGKQLKSRKSLTKKPATNKILAYLYSSPDILSLAWVEVMWAIVNGVYAHTCDICGGVFRLEGKYRRDAYICPNNACQTAHRIENMGGSEKIKEYNRVAKARSRKGLNSGKNKITP